MRNRSLAVLLFGAVAVAVTACESPAPHEPLLTPAESSAARKSAAQPTPYVIVFNASTIPADAGARIAAAGGELARTIPQVGVALAYSDDPDFPSKVSARMSVEAVDVAAAYEVPQVGPGEVVTLDGHADGPTGEDIFYPFYGWNIRRVHAPAAWEVTTGSHNTVVAVIDGGIASNHPDLAPNLVFATCFSLGVECTAYPAYTYHGTHVAGTVAAAFGHGGVIGVGPDLGLASYSVFEPIEGCGICAYSFSSWSSLVDATERGFHVANLSLGSLGANWLNPANRLAWSRVTRYAVQNGLVVIASAGNQNLDLNGPIYHVPSDANLVVSVGATGIRPRPAYPQPGFYDVKASYSNYGAAVALVAPGGDVGGAYLIASTGVFPDPKCARREDCPIAYFLAGGTSMAAPHVSGVAGLIRDADPSLSANEVIARLKDTAADLGDRQLFGHGMVDAGAAVR